MRVHIPNRAHWLRRCFDDKPKKFTASRQHTIPVDSCAIWAHLAVSLPLRSDMQKARHPHNGRAIYFVVCVSPKRTDALADVLGCVCFNVYEVVSLIFIAGDASLVDHVIHVRVIETHIPPSLCSINYIL